MKNTSMAQGGQRELASACWHGGFHAPTSYNQCLLRSRQDDDERKSEFLSADLWRNDADRHSSRSLMRGVRVFHGSVASLDD